MYANGFGAKQPEIFKSSITAQLRSTEYYASSLGVSKKPHDNVNLKGTDLACLASCFGTMTFRQSGERTSACDADGRLLHRCRNQLLDTANVYQQGASEEMLGQALQGRRDKVVLASKVRGKMGEGAEESGSVPRRGSPCCRGKPPAAQDGLPGYLLPSSARLDVPLEENARGVGKACKAGERSLSGQLELQ